MLVLNDMRSITYKILILYVVLLSLNSYAADGRRLRTEYLLSNMQIMEREGIGDGLTPMSGGIAGGDSPDFIIPELPLDPGEPVKPSMFQSFMVRDYYGNHL